MFKRILTLLLFISIPLGKSSAATPIESVAVDKITIFKAKKFITMDQAQPEATAVAVSQGKIVAVGDIDSLRSWMQNREVTIDETYIDQIVLPGFVEPHVHPSLPAITTQFPFIAPENWSLPTGEFPAARSNQQYLEQLNYWVTKHDDAQPFVTWGYHPLWHGEVYRKELDSLFPDTAVILWHRSFHELIANTAALTQLGISAEDLDGVAGTDYSKGHFWELGAHHLVSKMSFIFEPRRYSQGLLNFVKMLHHGGITSAMDMGTGIFGDAVAEMLAIQRVVEASNAPTRITLTPIVTDFIARGVSPSDAVKEVASWKKTNSDQVAFANHFKLMLDGAIFSGLAQFGFPGYMDGHHGEWLVPYKESLSYARAFWDNGYQIHAHTNGDKSAEIFIKLVKELSNGKPTLDHRSTLEHFAYTTSEQLQELGNLGVAVSANPYYQYILSDLYADKWLGEDRARNMVPLGGAVRNNIKVGLHSDSPMAPLNPLTLVSTAVNRVTINGNKNNQTHSLSLDEALRAITIDAAWIMRKEHEIGSIVAGKYADFVVLDKDPYKVKPSKIGDIRVLATVFKGNKHPVKK